MNLRAIPWTTAAIRVALEANRGDEAQAAWSVWNVMKVTPVLRDAVVEELSTHEVVWGPTVSKLEREQLGLAEGDAEAAYESLRELIDPRENPALASKITGEAGKRFVLAFKAAVAAVAADWREGKRE